MSHHRASTPRAMPRRSFLERSLSAGAIAAAGPTLLAACGDEQQTDTDLGPYESAGINWRKAEGTTINVAVIPATYFSNLLDLLPQFQELTGITVETQEVPPKNIRENVVRDLSTGTGRFNTHAADPMYYPLYAANEWVEPLRTYLEDEELCNPEWFQLDDIFEIWRESASSDGTLYGMPYDGEVTVQVYRTDVYADAGLSPAETFDQFRSNAEALNDPDGRLWGTALRGVPGAGQNMYILPSLFMAWGGSWFDDSGNPTVNSSEFVDALTYYVDLLNNFAPRAVVNWNWPDIAEAFARGTLGSYIDAHSSAAVLTDPARSVVADSLGFARWPEGPGGRRCTSIWNWSFPINKSAPKAERDATWLFLQWATSKETQIRTSHGWEGASQRSGVNRTSIWESDEYAQAVGVGENFVDAALTSLQEDTDIDWRPRIPQWPAIGSRMAVLVQEALTGQASPQAALDNANREIEKIMEEGG